MSEDWPTERELLDLMPSPPQTVRELDRCARIARFIQTVKRLSKRLREAREG